MDCNISIVDNIKYNYYFLHDYQRELRFYQAKPREKFLRHH